MSKTKCIIFSFRDEAYNKPVNCPNCGKFLKWNYDKVEYECVCNGIINLVGDSEGNYPEDFLRVCKKPKVDQNE